jgi:DnaT DNA-binding domain
MSPSSIIPERQLVFSPELAATIGLEEAILLQHLQQACEHLNPNTQQQFAYFTLERAYLLQSLPFWGTEDLHRITRSLADKGVILIESPPLLSATQLIFAVNEQTATPQSPATTSRTAEPAPAPTRRSAGLLPVHWGPSEDLLQLLSLNHNIPRQYALDQLEDFIFYWRERGETSHAWENKFRQHVTANWRRQQQQDAASFQVTETRALDNNWRPSADAMEIMQRANIDQDFIEQAIPEFILYWRERGTAPKELNSKFVQHIRIQWAKYTSALEHSTEPKRINENWQPPADVYDVLQLSHIDAEFARALLPEFIVYWRESNQVQTSWSSKFIQHVKYHWAKRHKIEQTEQANAGYQGPGATGRTRDRSLRDDLSDTSWAK